MALSIFLNLLALDQDTILLGIYDPKLVLRNVGDSERIVLENISLAYYLFLPNESVEKVLYQKIVTMVRPTPTILF